MNAKEEEEVKLLNLPCVLKLPVVGKRFVLSIILILLNVSKIKKNNISMCLKIERSQVSGLMVNSDSTGCSKKRFTFKHTKFQFAD